MQWEVDLVHLESCLGALFWAALTLRFFGLLFYRPESKQTQKLLHKMASMQITLSLELQVCVLENDLKALRRRLRAFPDKKAKGLALFTLIASEAPLEKFQVFLEAGADVDVKWGGADVELTLLMFASMIGSDYVELLLRHGAKIEVKDNIGHTALNFACLSGEISIANLLLERGANIKTLNNNKGCVLMSVQHARKNMPEMMHFLISKGATMENVDAQGFTPLLYAVTKGFWVCVEILLKSGANAKFVCLQIGETALHLALQHVEKDALKVLQVVKLLLKYGADVNAVDTAGATPLIGFCFHASCAPIVQLLLQYGADVNSVFLSELGDKTTPLLVACQTDIRIAKLLLQAGAEPNQNMGSCTLLEYSTCVEVPRDPIIHLLLKTGADVNIK